MPIADNPRPSRSGWSISAMQDFRTSVCTLGGGAAGLLGDLFLRRMAIDSTVVSKSSYGIIAPVLSGVIRFSPVPIFINAASDLFRRMGWEQMRGADYLKVTHLDVAANDTPQATIRSGSYAEFLVERYDGAVLPLILAQKHLGPVVFTDALPEVRRKVMSHYPPAGGRGKPERIGFLNGLCPYFVYLERQPRGRIVPETVRRIDLRGHCVFTRSHTIHYDHLIVTIPLLEFLQLAGMQTKLAVRAAGAKFVVLKTDEPLTPNVMIYDGNERSAVYRAFIPRTEIVIVQLARSSWDSSLSELTARVQELLGLAGEPRVLRHFTIEDCYPLAVSDYGLKRLIEDELHKSAVTLFGRFSQWEYRDLDELEWERFA